MYGFALKTDLSGDNLHPFRIPQFRRFPQSLAGDQP